MSGGQLCKKDGLLKSFVALNAFEMTQVTELFYTKSKYYNCSFVFVSLYFLDILQCFRLTFTKLRIENKMTMAW